MRHDRENDLYDEWGELERVGGILLRYRRSILAVTALVTTFAGVAALSRPPVYRSEATLKLDDENARAPILDDLLIPTGTIDSEAAVASLTAYDLIRQLARPPPGWRVAHPGHPDYERSLGLTTRVEDSTVGTLGGFLLRTSGRLSGDLRLFARLEPVDPGAPEAILIRFLGSDRVSMSVPPGGGSVSWPEGVQVEADYVPEGLIEVRGVHLRLVIVGVPDDRFFLVRHLSEEEAVADLQDRLRVTALPDNANLVRLGVEHSDPHLATEIANAITTRFLEDDTRRTRGRAQDIVDYIDEALTLRHRELSVLNHRITRILEDYPDAIDIQKSFVQLNARRGTVDAKRLATVSLSGSLGELHEQIVSGNRSMASRLGQQLDDPMTRSYLDSIATLVDDKLRVERDETGEYQNTLRLKHSEVQDRLQGLELRLAELDGAIAELEAGHDDVLSRFQEDTARLGMVAVDIITVQYAEDYAELAQELSELEAEFTSEYYAVEIKRRQIDHLRSAILSHLGSLRRPVALRIDQMADLVSHWSELLKVRPIHERERIDAAIDTLWGKVEKSVAARIAGLLQEERDLVEELHGLDTRISDLPEAQRQLENSTMEREALERVVGRLLEKKEMAEVAVGGTLPTVQLFRRARVPATRLSPSLHLALAIGLLLGAILSAGSCLLHDRLRGRMSLASDYDGLLGLPLCATLPRPPKHWSENRHGGEACLGSFDDPDGPGADAFRALRARLRRLERDRGPLRTIAVTSCRAGEGKSAVNMGVAVAHALGGQKVLLIDANLHLPTIHEHLGLERTPGLSESLDGRKHWTQCVRPTAVAGVDVLVAGHHCYAPSDLLSGPNMERLLAEVKGQYDLTVLDLPDTDGQPDVECVGPLLDAVLLLYCEELGPAKSVVIAAIQRLRASGTRLEGVVRQSGRREIQKFGGVLTKRNAA